MLGPNRVAVDMREMENLIFWWIIRIFGEFLWIFGDSFVQLWEIFWNNWFVVRRLRTTIWDQQRKWGFEATRNNLRLEIYGPNQGGAISQKNGQFSDPGGKDRLLAPLVAGRSLLDPCSFRSKTPSPWRWQLQNMPKTLKGMQEAADHPTLLRVQLQYL